MEDRDRNGPKEGVRCDKETEERHEDREGDSEGRREMLGEREMGYNKQEGVTKKICGVGEKGKLVELVLEGRRK